MDFRQAIFQDFWVHLGALIAVSIGLAGWWQSNQLKADPSSIELMFIIGGLAFLGVRLINGSSALLRQALKNNTVPAPTPVVP